jgi:hypothetical protein
MIFGIGLSKTGTTSLFAALDQLGYRSATYRHMRALGLEDWFEGNFATDYLAGYDAATDLPLAVFYPQLDERYPGSKFVLTVRELDSWLESAERHFAVAPASEFGRQVRLATYGITGFDAGRFRHVYETHLGNVDWHFRHRPDALLTLDIVGGEGWAKLCPFLGRSEPYTVFPHVQPGYRPPSESAARAGI